MRGEFDETYLKRLMDECNDLRERTEFVTLDTEALRKTFLPTKGVSPVGYHRGYYEMIRWEKNGLSERNTIRSNCRSFLEICRGSDGRLLQVTSIKNGRTDCIHQGLSIGSKHFLFPFSAKGGFYPTYTYVTVTNGDRIVEEYAVEGRSIVYHSYESGPREDAVRYYRVNYVEGGSHPILEESKGIITLKPLEYREQFYRDWRG